jgi:hypothetical protein
VKTIYNHAMNLIVFAHNVLIGLAKLAFVLITLAVSAVALATLFSDVQLLTRLYWVSVGIACWGVLSQWKKIVRPKP